MKPGLLVVGLAIAAIGGVLWWTRDDAADVHALESRIRTLQTENAELRGRRIPRTDTVYRIKKDTLRVVRTRTDSVLLTDTLWRVERVREILGTERAACDSVIATCEIRVAQRDTALARADTILWAKDSVIGLLTKPCRYLGIGGPCPALSVFGGVTSTGKPVVGVGLSFPIKRIRVRF